MVINQLGFSNHEDARDMLTILKTNGLLVEPVINRHFGNEIMTIYAARLEDNQSKLSNHIDS